MTVLYWLINEQLYRVVLFDTFGYFRPPYSIVFNTEIGHTTCARDMRKMYEVRVAGVKGLGVFAKSCIPRGTRIFSEPPLIAIRHDEDAGEIYTASLRLSPQDRQKLWQLSAHTTTELSIMRWAQAMRYSIKKTASEIASRLRRESSAGIKLSLYSLKTHVRVLNIFRSNSFGLGSKSPFYQALFPQIARINHSCVANAQGNFHEGLGHFNIHATRDIAVDEELTLNYLEEHGAAREARQKQLLDGYGFTCDCPACDLSSHRGCDGEDRRLNMHELLGAYAQGIEEGGIASPDGELKMVQVFIDLLEADGIAGHELATL
jgi:hypothetical protein